MADVLEKPSVEFQDAAAPAAVRQSINVTLDADVLHFIQAEGLDLSEHLNGLARFYMDTTQQLVRDADPDGWEPGEMQTSPEPPSF